MMKWSLVSLSLVGLACCAQVASAQLTDSLARYYKMDESAGAAEAVDELDTANNLTVSANSRKSLPTSGVTGQMGNAWDFEKNPMTTVGDYNSSGGPIDGTDFLVWQQNFGTANILPTDPTPGVVDGTDLTNWENNFGLELNDTPLTDSQGYPLGQFLDEGNVVWDGNNGMNGVYFSIWVKPESLNTGIGEESRNVIISEDSATQDFYVRSTEGGKVEMAFEGIGEVITDNVELTVGQWSHISGGLIVDDGFEFTNTLILYVDGAQAGFNDFASINNPDSLNDLALGIQDDRADDIDELAEPDNPLLGYYARTSWDGLMDDAAFWRRTLDSTEVTDIFTRGSAGMGLLEVGALSAVLAVPEPTTLGLIVLGTAMTTVTRRRRATRRRRSVGCITD